MVLKRLKNRPSAIPFVLFGIGIIFFGVGVLRPLPSEEVNPFLAFGVLFFGLGIIVGLANELRKRKKR